MSEVPLYLVLEARRVLEELRAPLHLRTNRWVNIWLNTNT